MRLSVIIPYMEADSGKQAILERCLDSIKGANQIIVVENWKEGYAVPINYGLSQATGDFLLVMNDDLIWHDGSLKKLCDIDAVTSPLINGVEKPFLVLLSVFLDGFMKKSVDYMRVIAYHILMMMIILRFWREREYQCTLYQVLMQNTQRVEEHFIPFQTTMNFIKKT